MRMKLLTADKKILAGYSENLGIDTQKIPFGFCFACKNEYTKTEKKDKRQGSQKELLQ